MNAYREWLFRRPIEDLDGRTMWFWPGLFRQWAQSSNVPVLVCAWSDGRVNMLGKWGCVTGVSCGVFASEDLAVEAAHRVRDCLSATWNRASKEEG